MLMATNFQISYTLDVLFYIECMLDEEKQRLFDEDIQRFMPMLGTVSDKHLKKLSKIYKTCPQMITNLVSIIIGNEYLHTWNTEDLFDRHKHLIMAFKKSSSYKFANISLKRFITGDYAKVMPSIKIIVSDLKRLEFQRYWLEEKLPLLKERTTEHEAKLNQFKIADFVNHWLINKKVPATDQWYMLAYSDTWYLPVLNEYNLVSPLIRADELFERVIDYGLLHNTYRTCFKTLKPDEFLKQEYKEHSEFKSFKNFNDYAVKCFKMALRILLMENCGYKKAGVDGNYPLASEFLTYLREHPKPYSETPQTYLTVMAKSFSKK